MPHNKQRARIHRRQKPEGLPPRAGRRSRYTCPGCDLNAWAKPGVKLICGECESVMEEAG